MVPLLDVVMQM